MENQKFISDSLSITNSYKNTKASIFISENQVSWEIKNQQYSIPLNHVIGCAYTHPVQTTPCCSSSSSVENAARRISPAPTGFWSIFAFHIEKNAKGELEKQDFREIVFACSETDALACVTTLREALQYPCKKLIFIANPYGGQGKAIKTYNRIVLPIMKMANMERLVELKQTEYAGHATEIGQKIDYEKYAVACTISGDGVFHELLNGLLTRPDWEKARMLPIASIGAGSANALGKNIDLTNPLLATLAVLKCKTRKLDIMSCIQNQTVTYSHLSLSWAFIADVDIESEKWRYLGSLRFTLMALKLLIKFKSYAGKLYMLPSDQANSFTNPDIKKPVPFLGPTCQYTSPHNENYKKWPIVIDSSFQFFIACNLPWISGDFLTCPQTKMDNGELDIICSDKLDQSSTLSVLLDSERGLHMTFDSIKHYRVKAFVIDPVGPQTNSAENLLPDGIFSYSGEKIPYQPIQIEVHPKMMNLIVPDWLDDTRWEKKFRREFPNYIN